MTLTVALTTGQHYRAACDVGINNNVAYSNGICACAVTTVFNKKLSYRRKTALQGG